MPYEKLTQIICLKLNITKRGGEWELRLVLYISNLSVQRQIK